MARIRSIKPEFPHSESMGEISREARLCFIMLWTIADDSGRLRGNSRMLASLLYPYDNDAPKLIDRWLTELQGVNCIIRYQVDGNNYIEICNWLIHQKIDKPSRSKLPSFDDSSRILANPREGSSEDQRIGSKDMDQGSGSRKGSAREARGAADAVACPDDCPPDIWSDFVAHRKSVKAPVTQTAVDGIRREAIKAGLSLPDALREICSRGWRGFKAEWMIQQQAKGRKVQPVDDDPEGWIHKSLRKGAQTIEGDAICTPANLLPFGRS